MAGGRIGGQGSPLKRGIWIFVACCIVVAVWNSFPHDPRGFYRELGHRSEDLKGVAYDVKEWLALDRLETKTDDPHTGHAKHGRHVSPPKKAAQRGTPDGSLRPRSGR